MGIAENGCVAIVEDSGGLVDVSGVSRFFEFFVRRALLASAFFGILEWPVRVCGGAVGIGGPWEAHGKSRIPHFEGVWSASGALWVP